MSPEQDTKRLTHRWEDCGPGQDPKLPRVSTCHSTPKPAQDSPSSATAASGQQPQPTTDLSSAPTNHQSDLPSASTHRQPQITPQVHRKRNTRRIRRGKARLQRCQGHNKPTPANTSRLGGSTRPTNVDPSLAGKTQTIDNEDVCVNPSRPPAAIQGDMLDHFRQSAPGVDGPIYQPCSSDTAQPDQPTASPKNVIHDDADCRPSVDVGIASRGSLQLRASAASHPRPDDHRTQIRRFQKRPLRQPCSFEISSARESSGSPFFQSAEQQEIPCLPPVPQLDEGDFRPSNIGPLLPQGCSDLFGEQGFLDASNRSTDSPYALGRPGPGSSAVCRPEPPSARTSTAETDECVAGLPVDPGWADDIPTELAAAPLIYDVNWLTPSDTLQFTPQEWSSLHSAESSIETDLAPVMDSSARLVGTKVNGLRLRPQRNSCTLPLAAITTSRINIAALYSLPLPVDHELNDLLAWITDPHKLWNAVSAHPDYSTVRDGRQHHISRHSLDMYSHLLESGVVARGSYSHGIQCPVFRVPKSNGASSRFIINASPINDLLPPIGIDMRLPNLQDVIQRVLRSHFVWEGDARHYFYQFPMSRGASSLFSLRFAAARGDFYDAHAVAMPMGWKYAPHIGQHTASFITANAVHEAITAHEPTVACSWVDNFFMGATTLSDAHSLRDSLRHIAATVNLLLDEGAWEKPATPFPELLGLKFDLSSADPQLHNVSLSTEFTDSLSSSVRLLQSSPTPRTLFAVLGALMWSSYTVLRLPLCQYSAMMDFMRSTARSILSNSQHLGWDSPIVVHPEVLVDIHCIAQQAITAKTTLAILSTPTVKPTLQISTDASSSALGVIIDDGASLWGMMKPHNLPNIFLAELLIAAEGLALSQQLWPTRMSSISVDNTAARYVLLRGHSSSAAGDLILRKLISMWTIRPTMTILVPSACQVADPASRRWPAARPTCSHNHISEWTRWR